jgi:hypothetical protein
MLVLLLLTVIPRPTEAAVGITVGVDVLFKVTLLLLLLLLEAVVVRGIDLIERI